MRHDDTQQLLERARKDPAVLAEIFNRNRSKLERMVELRLEWRLRSSIDAADVLQGAILEAAESFPRYLERPDAPLFLWLRCTTGDSRT